MTVYLDNILIFIKGSREEYIKDIKKILRKLKEEDIILKLKKYKFFKEEIKYLGYIISRKRL